MGVMKSNFDYLIVGSGFFGAICVNELTKSARIALFGDRLADYKYYDMHNFIERALDFVNQNSVSQP